MAKLVVNHSRAASGAVAPTTTPSACPDLLQPELREAPAAPVVARPRCVQCGKTLRTMPQFIAGITCRECYGTERYSRGPGIPIGPSSLSAPLVDNTYTA